uniref:hypothetical protein n=1 Tax=Ruminococcus sp. TaxID=41978 RepID=UPI004029CA19
SRNYRFAFSTVLLFSVSLIFSVHIVNFPPEHLPISQEFTLGNEKAAFSAPSKKPDGSPSIG